MLVAAAEFRRQLKALMKRNLLLKLREPIQTVLEILIPICIYVAVSLTINSLQPSDVVTTDLPPNSTIKYDPVELNFNGTYNRPGPVLLVINTRDPEKRWSVYRNFKKTLGPSATVELITTVNNATIAEKLMKRRYLYHRKRAIGKKYLPVGVTIDLQQIEHKVDNPFGLDVQDLFGMYNYYIMLAAVDLPPLPSSFLDTGLKSCLPEDFDDGITTVDPTTMDRKDCAALYYPTTGFMHLQHAVQRAVLINAGGQESALDSEITWEMLPRTMKTDLKIPRKGNDITSTFASFTVYLAGIAVINLFSALVSGAVTEKEKGARETMLLMGMNCLIWKMSWFIVYLAEMLLITCFATLFSYVQKLISAQSCGVFFLLLLTYGFALVCFGLLLISFFKTARAAATATSFVFVSLGLPFIIVKFLKIFKQDVSKTVFYLLSFLFPFAFQHGLDLVLKIDKTPVGVPVHSEISVWGMILMLILDGFLYLLIGLLIDYLPEIIADYYLSQRTPVGLNECAPLDVNNNGDAAKNVEHDSLLESRRAIVISKLTKWFSGQNKPAVDNLSLTIYGGQITCLLGHNGAGKTTLLRILTGSLKSYEGKVNIFNWQVESHRDIDELRRDIGVCAQQNTLFDNLTCAEHLSFVLELKSDASAETRTSIVAETMADVSLTDRANTKARCLSGGEKRKLCLAMAIIAKPRLLFLDEPTAGVDVYCRHQIWDVLTQYKQADRVVLLTTHYMDEADMLADRKALMHCGKLYSAGSSMFLRQRFGCGYRLTVELDASAAADSARTESISSALRAVMPSISQLESERSRSELVYALPTGEENIAELLNLLRFLESDQTQLARYGVLCYGWSIATLDEVFLKLEEEVVENNQEMEKRINGVSRSNSNNNRQRNGFLGFFRQRTTDLELADLRQSHGVPAVAVISGRNGHANGNGIVSAPPPPISFEGIDVPEASPKSLRRHVNAIVYLRLIQSLRNIKLIAMRFFFPIILAIVGLGLSKFLMSRLISDIMSSVQDEGVARTSLFVYQPFIYANVSSSLTSKLKETMMDKLNSDENDEMIQQISSFTRENGPFLLLKNMTTNTTASQGFSGMIDMMTSVFMKTESITLDRFDDDSITAIVEKYGSKIGAYFEIGDNGISYRKLLFSHSAVHGLPILLAYSDAIAAIQQNQYLPVFLPFLQSFSSASREVIIQAYTSNFMFTLLFALHVLTMLPSLGFDVVRDQETGCATQIKLAGISKMSYWLGSMTVDAVEYAIFLLIYLVAARAFDAYSMQFAGACYAYLIYVLLVVPANVLMIYCITLFTKTFRIFSSVVTMVASMTGFFPFLAAFFWSLSLVLPISNGSQMEFADQDVSLRYDADWLYFLSVISFLFPAFNAAAGVFLIAFVSQPNLATLQIPATDVSEYLTDKILNNLFVASTIHIIIFGSIICIYENWLKISHLAQSSMKSTRFLNHFQFRKKAYLKSAQFANGTTAATNGLNDHTHAAGEDDDVVAERRDVYELGNAPISSDDNLAPFISDVRKVYTSCCRDCKLAHEAKTAVDDVSFKLHYGQVFGLLGPNGAGKTTLIKMLIGSERPTSGSIFARATTLLGYCPQESVLWDQLTGEEHILIYAYSRGFSPEQRRILAQRLANGLGISVHLKKQTKHMSGGTKRKLCVALSLLGRPSVLCLDEPSAGMDPGSKRFLWRVIKQIFSQQQDGWNIAGLLTTHHLEEAENLCHRIAIMVNGSLKCIGSRQHLKTKYGRYYTLEVILGNDQLIDSRGAGLIDFIDKLLPGSMPHSEGEHEAPQLINSFGRHFVFRIPSCRVRSLAKIFTDLEKTKEDGLFSSYSFSQVSLEQIFIQFAKEQYEEDF